MSQWDYIKTDEWFAWYPVQTDAGWVWFEKVKRTIDSRPVQYQGLLPEITYEKIINKTNIKEQ